VKLLDAIQQADELRPNDLPEERKAAWLCSLEADFADVMGVDTPENHYPEDRTLLMPFPYDDAYVPYLAAMIDLANQDTALYANDKAVADEAAKRARARWRREHRPKSPGNWRVM